MTEPMKLMPRDRDILQALTMKVRLFSQRQIAEYWFGGELANARRRMKRLAAAKLVCNLTVLARPLPSIHSPLISWAPGERTPDYGAIAYRCQRRWRMRPPRPCTAWLPSERATQLFGGAGSGDLKRPFQATHDLGVAAIWLLFRRISPQWAEAWRGEDLLAETRRGEKIPDAFLVDGQDQVFQVIEFGGGYDLLRVKAFHEDCAARDLPYQLW